MDAKFDLDSKFSVTNFWVVGIGGCPELQSEIKLMPSFFCELLSVARECIFQVNHFRLSNTSFRKEISMQVFFSLCIFLFFVFFFLSFFGMPLFALCCLLSAAGDNLYLIVLLFLKLNSTYSCPIVNKTKMPKQSLTKIPHGQRGVQHQFENGFMHETE